MPQILKILRQKRGPAVAVESFEGFGAVLRPGDDPDGIEIPDNAFKAIHIEATYPIIPKDLIGRIVSLYIWLMEKRPGGTQSGPDMAREVSVVLLRDTETMKRWRVLVPRQVVGSTSVEADFTKGLCDIETGEEIATWPPEGWSHAGSSHSHNHMRAFFSPTDDRSELPVPGVHFVCGNFVKANDKWSYEIAPSIVYKMHRYESVVVNGKVETMDWKHILDATLDESKHHDKVMEYVTIEPPKVWDSAAFRTVHYPGQQAFDYDDFSGFGYGLEGEEWKKDAISRYYRDTERGAYTRDTPEDNKYTRMTRFGERTCMIPLEGIEHPPDKWDIGRDHVRQFTCWVQEDYGIATLELRKVYVMKDGTIWCPSYEGVAKGGGLVYMRLVELELYEKPINMARAQRKYDKRKKKEVKGDAPVVLPLIHGVDPMVFAKNFTEEEIIALCQALGRDPAGRTALRIGFGKAVSKANIELSGIQALQSGPPDPHSQR